MIFGLKPYADVKESGVPGVGAVPLDWRVRKLRNVLSPVTERNRPDLPLLSVVRERGVVLRDIDSKEENHNFIPDDLSNYKVVRAGQFAMNKMKAWQGSYGVSRYDGIVSPAYFTFALNGVEGDFFHLAIRSSAYIPFFTQASDGVRVGQWDLSQSRMKEIPFLIPPPDEQAAIVRFLDHADRRIRRAIAAKQKLIRLLEEQKRAIIHRAVTRGLDPDVHFKPSGIEWLADVPEHWEIRAFSRCAIERADYRGATPTKTESGMFLVTARNVRKGMIDYQISKEYVAESDYATVMRRGLPKIGDVLLTMEAPLGNVALVDREDVAFAQRVVRFRMDPEKLVPEFVLNSMLSPYFQNQLLCRGTGSTALGIKASKLPQLQILCPSVFEQNEILENICRDVTPMDAAMDRTRAEIELLREYRIRMVADVVTGKIDVHVAADNFPEIIETDDTEFDTEGENEEESMQDGAVKNQAA